MDFAIISDPALNTTAVVAATLFLVSLLCVLAALLLRFLRLRRERHSAALEAVWRPMCFAAMVDDLPPGPLQPISKAEAPLFAEIWLDCIDRIRGDSAHAGLLRLAQRLRLRDAMRPALHSGRTDLQLLALQVLGFLRDSAALPMAEKHLDSSYPLLSLAAAKALMEIDPQSATPLIMDRLETPGWPLGRISQLLRIAPPKVLRKHLAAHLDHESSEHIANLLLIFHTLADSEFDHAAKRVLRRFPDDLGVLRQILRLNNDPAMHPLVQFSCSHADDDARFAALEALGRIGSLADQDLLVEHLRHDGWRHQQASARALVQLPGMTATRAQAILATLDNPDSILHWQEALYNESWLPADSFIERPVHA